MNAMNSKASGEWRRLLIPPPPPNFLGARRAMKKTWLLCVFLFCILALPVQSQALLPALTNPTAANLSACGLPSQRSNFNASAPIKTFNMTSDCVFGAGTFDPGGYLLDFSAGTFIINGNGHSISGPNDLIRVSGSSAILNLNNVVIRQTGRTGEPIVRVRQGGRFNAHNIIFTDNDAGGLVTTTTPSTSAVAYLENVQAYDNRMATSPFLDPPQLFLAASNSITINNGIFLRNSGINQVATVQGNGARLTLQGCMTFADNVRADGTTAAANTGAGIGTTTITDNSIGACPAEGFSYWLSVTPQKKSKKTATPRPSATSRPLATTCIDLNQATGIVVRATYGLASGVQCQRLGGGGIGVQAIVDGGFIDAVDIWGYVEQGVEVCFPQAGELLFLDARTMPRAIAPLESYIVNGMTCGAVETPGSIVLMPAG